MRLLALGIVLLALIGVGGYAVTAGKRYASTPGAKPPSAAPSSKGAAVGQSDVVQASVCRFACATKMKYDPKDLVPQPGAKDGQLTQCPVSGVVFAVDDGRPHVRHADRDSVVC